MEEQVNKEPMQARMEVCSGRSKDHRRQCKHTSGGVFVAIGSCLGAVVDKEEGVATSVPGDEGRIVQAWVNVRRVCGVFFCHVFMVRGRMDENEALMEAVVKQARTTRHPWLVACHANMNPEDFRKSLWYKSRHMFIATSGEGISANGVLIERERMTM